MPELRSENPSRDELQSYLNEHWRTTKEVIDYFRANPTLKTFAISQNEFVSDWAQTVLKRMENQ